MVKLLTKLQSNQVSKTNLKVSKTNPKANKTNQKVEAKLKM